MVNVIWTIGHSTRAWEAFLDLLQASAIQQLADVRRFPGSRRHPQFNREAMETGLRPEGVAYRHFEALGGRRSARQPDSPNTAWRVAAFNAFADSMATDEFARTLEDLTRWAAQGRTVLMCSEAVPWRCHRRLIADALIVRGWTVWDIIGPGNVDAHKLTAFARVRDGRITYPAMVLDFDDSAR
jgi:uncharacterized protein (DUF488 family)